MSARQGLFYAESLGNDVNCIFLSIFFAQLFFKKFSIFILHPVLSNMETFLDRSVWPIDGTLIGTTSLDQSGPGSNVYTGTGASPSDAV